MMTKKTIDEFKIIMGTDWLLPGFYRNGKDCFKNENWWKDLNLKNGKNQWVMLIRK